MRRSGIIDSDALIAELKAGLFMRKWNFEIEYFLFIVLMWVNFHTGGEKSGWIEIPVAVGPNPNRCLDLHLDLFFFAGCVCYSVGFAFITLLWAPIKLIFSLLILFPYLGYISFSYRYTITISYYIIQCAVITLSPSHHNRIEPHT